MVDLPEPATPIRTITIDNLLARQDVSGDDERCTIFHENSINSIVYG